MNGLEAALLDVVGFLDEARVPYMVIGGFANLYWGRPRMTRDLDITVQVPDSELPAFVERVRARYHVRPDEPLDFVRRLRVLPILSTNGTPVDLVLAGMPYEVGAISRARALPVAGRTICFCAPEDLVLHKLASARPRDREDVEGILSRQGGKLDRAYLDPLVEELARALEQPEILEFYRRRSTEAE